MSGKKWFRGVWTPALAIALATTAAAGGPAAVGSLVGSRNTTLDGQTPLAHTVLLSGDKLKVNDGFAMVTLERGNRMILGRDSEAVFLREADLLTVRMARGNFSLYHPPEGSRLRVRAGDVTVAPVDGQEALGEISLSDGLLVVAAKGGLLKIEKDGTTSAVAKGHKLITTTAAQGTAASALPGNSRLKLLVNHGASHSVGSSAGGASAAALEFALHHHHHRHASPTHPGR